MFSIKTRQRREFPEGGVGLLAGIEGEQAGPLQIIQGEEVLIAVALHHQPPVQLQQPPLQPGLEKAR
jgi:hypothetical protein